MPYFLTVLLRLFLLPLRSIALGIALSGVALLYVVGLGRAYLTTIVRNIVAGLAGVDRLDFDAERAKHTHILGATGAGKSCAIENLIDENLRKRQGVLLIEPHGELTDRVLANKRFVLRHRSQNYRKLLLLDFDHAPPAFNIFALPLPDDTALRRQFVYGLASDLTGAFALNMRPEMTEAQYLMLRNLFIAGFHMPKATVPQVLALLSENHQGPLQALLPDLPSPPLQDYFRHDFPSGSSRRTRDTLRHRLNSFLIPRQMHESLCAERCAVDFRAALAKGKAVIVRATTTALGTFEAVTIGNLIHAVFARYAFERLVRGGTDQPFFVYLDEAQYYMTESVERALTGARKTGVNYTLSHHEFGQVGMSTAAQRAIVNNCNVKIYGGLKWKDMKEGADILGLEDKQVLARLRPGEFIIKAGRRAPVLKRFPYRFAIKKAGFGRGWLVNAYAKPAETKVMLARIRPTPPPMYDKTVSPPAPPNPPPSHNFNPNGNLPFAP